MEEVRQVFVDSTNRDTTRYPHGNEYTLHLTQPIKDIRCVELVQAAIPNVSYNIPINLDPPLKQVVATVGGITVEFNIPPGFYSGTVLAFLLEGSIGNSISVDYVASEGKFLFLHPSDPFKIQFNDKRVAKTLGFLYDNISNVYNSSEVTDTHPDFTGSTSIPYTTFAADYYSGTFPYNVNQEFLKSPIIADLHKDNAAFLDIEELRTPLNEDARMIDGNTFSGNNMSRTFGLIPLDVDAGCIKTFKKNCDYEFCVDYPHVINKLDRLTIRWTDKDGTLLNFNGIEDNSFILRFHTLRKNM